MTARHTTLVCRTRPAHRVRGTSNKPPLQQLAAGFARIDAGADVKRDIATSNVTVTSGAFDSTSTTWAPNPATIGDSNDDGISEYAHLECTTKAVAPVDLPGVGITAMGTRGMAQGGNS